MSHMSKSIFRFVLCKRSLTQNSPKFHILRREMNCFYPIHFMADICTQSTFFSVWQLWALNVIDILKIKCLNPKVVLRERQMYYSIFNLHRLHQILHKLPIDTILIYRQTVLICHCQNEFHCLEHILHPRILPSWSRQK